MNQSIQRNEEKVVAEYPDGDGEYIVVDGGDRQADWAIVLADGTQNRRPGSLDFWEQELLPEMFDRSVGLRSPLQYAWDRASEIVGDNRIITIATDEQAPFFEKLGKHNIPGKLILQPAHNGTATSVCIALANILAVDPESRVIILPVEHFLPCNEDFVSLAKQMLCYIRQQQRTAVLFGVKPFGGHAKNSWILPDDERADSSVHVGTGVLLPITSLLVNPTRKQIDGVSRNGCLWNTNILVADSRWLWDLTKSSTPELFERAEFLYQVLELFGKDPRGESYARTAINHALYNLPMLDFSRHLLQPNIKNCLVLPIIPIDREVRAKNEHLIDGVRQTELLRTAS